MVETNFFERLGLWVFFLILLANCVIIPIYASAPPFFG